ncbi:HMG (high mobility group) box, partial [Haematococcus lacustris]
MKSTEITSELGRQWKEMDEGAKKKYHEKAEAEKARYKTEMKDY